MVSCAFTLNQTSRQKAQYIRLERFMMVRVQVIWSCGRFVGRRSMSFWTHGECLRYLLHITIITRNYAERSSMLLTDAVSL